MTKFHKRTQYEGQIKAKKQIPSIPPAKGQTAQPEH